jgi:PAS domain-containing protein
MNEDEELLECSDGYVEMTGYVRCELLGRTTRMLSHGCEEDTEPKVWMGIRRAVKSSSAFVASVVNRHKCGWLYFNTMYIRGLDVGVGTDSKDGLKLSLCIHHGGAERVDVDESGIAAPLVRAGEQVRADIGMDMAILSASKDASAASDASESS